MHRQSLQIPVQVIIAFSLFLSVETRQPSAFGEDGDLWVGAGGSSTVAVGLVLLDLSEHFRHCWKGFGGRW